MSVCEMSADIISAYKFLVFEMTVENMILDKMTVCQ